MPNVIPILRPHAEAHKVVDNSDNSIVYSLRYVLEVTYQRSQRS